MDSYMVSRYASHPTPGLGDMLMSTGFPHALVMTLLFSHKSYVARLRTDPHTFSWRHSRLVRKLGGVPSPRFRAGIDSVSSSGLANARLQMASQDPQHFQCDPDPRSEPS